jgi:hypothetical protein
VKARYVNDDFHFAVFLIPSFLPHLLCFAHPHFTSISNAQSLNQQPVRRGRRV